MKIALVHLSKMCPLSVLGFIIVDNFPVLSGKMLKGYILGEEGANLLHTQQLV